MSSLTDEGAFAEVVDEYGAIDRGREYVQGLPFRVAGIVVSVALLALSATWLFGAITGPYELQAVGEAVQHLEEDAKVVIGSQEVGRVREIRLVNAESTAILELDDEIGREIGRESRFVVASLNSWIPGNVGIRIEPVAGEPLPDGARIELAQAPIAKVPGGFWFAAALLVVLVGGTIALARVLHSLMLFAVGASAAVALAAWFSNAIG